MKIVAVDFDDTISDSPLNWLNVMRELKKSGYHVIVVTYRHPETDPHDLQFLVDHGYKVYFTSQVAKRKYMKSRGIDVDIWIDDSPETIVSTIDTKTWEVVYEG